MIHVFDGYELNTTKEELRSASGIVPVEPQVFALLRLLIENCERLVTRDEIIERIWDGRIVSDAAVASRIKSARQAIGDDGATQRLIRTAHRRGFRFVGAVTSGADLGSPPAPASLAGPREPNAQPAAAESARPSIAVLPFTLVGVAGPHASIADGLPHDLIVELSRLRWLFVIARGSSFQFRGADAKIDKVRDALGVRYCLSGVVEVAGRDIRVSVELCDARDGGVVWGESYRGDVGAVHDIRARITQSVVGALELQIPLNEARHALTSPENLDAWSAYHLGVRHMYQFSRDGNAKAAACFEQAVAKEPTFARAYAGLSFTHFEDAFLRFVDSPSASTSLAQRFAEQGLEQDPLDPFCNLVMGRASWLTGQLEASLPWLERAIELNPSYAQARYSWAWTKGLLGDAIAGQLSADEALKLSPLDPLVYGMLGVKALSLIVPGDYAEAVRWAEQAARAPRAHALMELIAAVAHGLNGDDERAGAWVRSARARHPLLTGEDFLSAFPFRDPVVRRRIGAVLGRIGL